MENLTRYAYIDPETNALLWGPGPMPYFITLKDGTMWEITAHTIEESEAVGIFVVEQINLREFDPRFEEANLPAFTIENGRPKETWSYKFSPPARVNMVNGIDELAEKLRNEVATKYPGQFAEYDQAYAEAQQVLALSPEEVIEPGMYTYLEADVNVTVSEPLGRPVQNVREAAELVAMMRNVWKIFGGNLRKARLLAKKQIREAADDAAAYVLYKEFANKSFMDYMPNIEN